jgi:predicted chitinase
MATICLTVEQLSQLFPKCSQDKLQQYFPHLIQAILEFEITSVLRMSAFLARIGHESSEFRWMEEDVKVLAAARVRRRMNPVSLPCDP